MGFQNNLRDDKYNEVLLKKFNSKFSEEEYEKLYKNYEIIL